MTNHDRRELPKLPQARMYLKSAQWGIDAMVDNKLGGYAFRLHLIGILASLRAVQHALLGHERTLSEAHKRVIDEWQRRTPRTVPELAFIETARNQILKWGAFRAYAAATELGEGMPVERAPTEDEHVYELVYDEQGNRRDLEQAIRAGIRWCEVELSAIEDLLPPVYAPE